MVGLYPTLEVLAAGPQREIPDPLSPLYLLEKLLLGKIVCQRITEQVSWSFTVDSANIPAAGHHGGLCHSCRDSCHNHNTDSCHVQCFLSQCWEIITAAAASATSIRAKPACAQGAQALLPPGNPGVVWGLKSPPAASLCWFLGTETQINPFGRRDETGGWASSASMGTVSLTCEEGFNDLEIQNLLPGDMITA